MFTKKSIQEYLTLTLCVLSLIGVALHDTKIDKLAAIGIGASVVAALHMSTDGLARLTDTAHTHVERISLKNLAFEQPRIQGRYLEDKMHMEKKNLPRGASPFENYLLPLT